MQADKRCFSLMIWVLALVLVCAFKTAFAIIPICGVVITVFRMRKNRVSSIPFLVIPWVLVFTLVFSRTIVYLNYKYNVLPMVYIVLCIVSISVGNMIGQRTKIKSNRIVSCGDNECYINIGENIKIINLLCVVSIFGSLCYSADILFVSGISLNLGSSGVRDLFVQRNISALSQIGAVTGWGAYFALLGLILLGKYISRKTKTFWILTVTLFSLFSIMSAGRQVVFQLMIIVIAGLLFYFEKVKDRSNKQERKYSKKIKQYAILVIVLIVVYFGYIAVTRNDGNISTSKYVVLKTLSNFDMDSEFLKLLWVLPEVLMDTIVEGIVYFTHELKAFSTMWNYDNSYLTLGGYSMPFIARRIEDLHLNYFEWQEVSDSVGLFLQSNGVSRYGWQTAFSFMLVDYGKIGTVIVCFVIGVFSGRAEKRYMMSRTFFNAAYLTNYYIFFVYTIMFPSISDTGVLLFLIASIVLTTRDRRRTGQPL